MSRKPVSENVTEIKKKFNPSLHTLLLSAPISCLKSNIRLIIFSNLTTEPLVHTETYTNETKLPSAAPFYQSCVPEVLPVIPESGIAGLGAMKTEG